MEEKEFKIGDRVKITGFTTGLNKQGDIGTIHKLVVIAGRDFAQINVGNQSDKYLESCHTAIKSLEHERSADEFQLPLNWVVRVTPGNVDQLTKFKRSIHPQRDRANGFSFINRYGFGVGAGSNDQIITFDQFKEHILKIKPEPIKTFEPLPFFKVLEVYNKNNDMLYVQNNEGNVFRLGDMIIGITEYSKKLGPMKITRFRKTVNTDNICAVTKEMPKYGIGIDKIQHIITINEEVKIIKESLLDKAKRLYPKGTKYITASDPNSEKIQIATGNAVPYINSTNRIMSHSGHGLIYCDGNWAKIIKD